MLVGVIYDVWIIGVQGWMDAPIQSVLHPGGDVIGGVIGNSQRHLHRGLRYLLVLLFLHWPACSIEIQNSSLCSGVSPGLYIQRITTGQCNAHAVVLSPALGLPLNLVPKRKVYAQSPSMGYPCGSTTWPSRDGSSFPGFQTLIRRMHCQSQPRQLASWLSAASPRISSLPRH